MSIFSAKIKSRFKQKESFDFMNTPKKFESVTDSTLRRLNRYCLHENKKLFLNNSEAGSIKAMLQAVAGKYNMAHSCLEGDYATRKGNLENAYIAGLAEISANIISFQTQVSDYNAKLDNFRRISKKIYGSDLPDLKKYDQAQIDELKKACESLKKGMK